LKKAALGFACSNQAFDQWWKSVVVNWITKILSVQNINNSRVFFIPVFEVADNYDLPLSIKTGAVLN
jgi:hypothetical protein